MLYTNSRHFWHHHPPLRHRQTITSMGATFPPPSTNIYFLHRRLTNTWLHHPRLQSGEHNAGTNSHISQRYVHIFTFRTLDNPSRQANPINLLPYQNTPPKLSTDSFDKPDCNMTPIDHSKTFGINVTNPKRKFRIGASLPSQLQRHILEHAAEFSHIFVWSPTDLGVISQSFMEHKLGISPSAKPVTQK